jgi:F-type H+-transporting ATPase subunit epsilon
MAGDLSLKIYTQTGLALDEAVNSLTLPTAMGEVGIYPEHARLVCLLDTGVLEYEGTRSGTTGRVVVSGGFATVADNTVVVLTDSFDSTDSVDVSKYSQERQNLEKVVSESGLIEPEGELARRNLARIQAIDKLLGKSAN